MDPYSDFRVLGFQQEVEQHQQLLALLRHQAAVVLEDSDEYDSISCIPGLLTT